MTYIPPSFPTTLYYLYYQTISPHMLLNIKTEKTAYE